MTSELSRKKRKIRLLYVLLVICIIAVIVSASGIVRELYATRQGRSYYTTLSADIETRPRSPGYSRPTENGSSTGTGSNDNGTNDFDHGFDDYIWEPYVDFEALGSRFHGAKAWIKLEGTLIDYPIMQWTDNYYFLGRLPDGTIHRSGSIFLDFRNNADFSDKHSLIYGHESRTEDMFGALKNYRRQAFYDENPVIHIYTPERDYELVLFAAYLVDSGVEVPPLRFNDESSFEAYINDLKRRSLFRSNVEVSPDDRIVSLCTCAYDYTNARLIIVGKLVEF